MAASPWIVSRQWDVGVCLATLWFPALLFVAWKGAEAIGVAPAEWVAASVAITLTLPHFLSTFTFTWMDPDQRRYYRRHRWLYYAIPGALILGCWGYSAILGPTLLVTIWLLFGEHHVAAQNIGFLSLYRQRNREGDVDRRIDHWVFNSAWITTVSYHVTRPPGESAGDYYARPTQAIEFADREGLVGALLIVSIGAFLCFLGRQAYRGWTGQGVSIPKLIFMCTTWPSFLIVPFAIENTLLVVLLRQAYHNVQYLGLVRLLNQRRCAARQEASGWLDRLAKLNLAGYMGVLILAAVALWIPTELLARHAGWANDLSLRYLFYPGVALAHFFLDGLTWRFGEPHARETVVPFLRPQPARVEAR